MRLKNLLVFALLLLAGCSSQTREGGTAAPAAGPSGTASLTLRVDVGPLAARARGTLTRLVIRVVDGQDNSLDVVDPLSIALENQSVVTQTVTDIPLGLRRVLLEVYDDAGRQVGGAQSSPLQIVAGVNPSLSLHVELFPTSSLRFVADPTGVLVGQPIAPTLQVELLDSQGQRASSNETVTLTLTTNPGGATLVGPSATAAQNGLASFPNLALDQPGSGYVLTATAPGFGSVSTGPFDVAAAVGPPAQLAFFTQPSDSMVGQLIAPPVQVLVQDANGVTVPTATTPVTLALGSNPGAATLLGTLSVVPNNGVATFPDLQLNVPGNGYTLVATSGALALAASQPFTVTNVPAQLAFGTQPSDGQARAVMTPFTVEVQDAFGNLVPGATDTVTVTLDQPPPTVSGTLSVAAVNGVATFNNVMVSKSGSAYTITASAPGLTPATSTAFDQSFPRGFLTPLAGLPGGFTAPLRGDMSTDGAFLYVGQFSTPGHVLGFSVNAASGALAALTGSPYSPLGDLVGGVAVTPDNTEVITTNASNGTFAKFTRLVGGDLAAGPPTTPTDAQPLGVVVRPGTPQYAYIMSNFSQSVTGFDLSTLLAVPGSGIATGVVTQTAVLHPNGNLLFVSSGSVLAINPANGGLSNVAGSPFATASGRSQAVNPAGTFLYTTQNGQIAVHSINPATGFLTPIAGSPFAAAGDLTSGKIVLNGEFLYAFAVGSTDIQIFALDPVTGVPTQLEDSPAPGTNVPFELITDPLDRFVYAAENATGQILGFRIVP